MAKDAVKKDCSCWQCVSACRRHPGWFLPGEAEKAAELLGVPMEEFVDKYLVKDACADGFGSAPYIYAPRKVRHGDDLEAGGVRTSEMKSLEAPCVFLKEDRCQIHAAKPFECRKAYLCRPYSGGSRDEIELRWKAAGAPLGMRPDPNEEVG